MSIEKEMASLRTAALKSPGEAHISLDGRTLVVSFGPREVYEYTGRDFSGMTLTEINEFIAQMDQK